MCIWWCKWSWSQLSWLSVIHIAKQPHGAHGAPWCDPQGGWEEFAARDFQEASARGAHWGVTTATAVMWTYKCKRHDRATLPADGIHRANPLVPFCEWGFPRIVYSQGPWLRVPPLLEWSRESLLSLPFTIVIVTVLITRGTQKPIFGFEYHCCFHI